MKLYLLIILLSLNLSFAEEDVLRPKGRTIDKKSSKNNLSNDYPKIAVGLELGLNYNIFSADMQWENELDQSRFAIYQNMQGFSAFFGAFVDYSFDEKIGLQAKLQYGNSYVTNEGDARYDCIQYDDFGNIISIDLTDTRTEYKYDFDQINLELYFRYNLDENIFLMGGLVILAPASQDQFEITNNILTEGCYYLEDPQNTLSERVLSRTIISNSDAVNTRVGLSLIGGYRYDVNESIWIAPNLQIQLLPTLILDDVTFPDDTQSAFRSSTGEIETSPDLTITNQMMNHIRFSVQVGFNLFN
jgi:hypothetical protein